MWPFKPDLNTLQKLEKAFPELLSLQRDAEQRLRLVERELEDLHARYRRLRATQGGDARVAAANAAQDDVPALTGKEALRARVFGGKAS